MHQRVLNQMGHIIRIRKSDRKSVWQLKKVGFDLIFDFKYPKS